jgi:hypothetical protein
MPKLNEIIAIASGRKGDVQKAVTDAYHKIQKEGLFDGLSRSYKPRTEDGERLPPEQKFPQLRVRDLIADASARWADLFDVTLTLDQGNCLAKADIVVDEQVLAKDVPVTTLLFLEKQLAEVRTFVGKLPVPDPSERWHYDSGQDALATEPSQTARTKKVQKPIVLYDATEHHPAQTQLITEDVIVGDWTQILYTARVPAQEKNAMLERVDKLQDAVKIARERANGIEVQKKKCGEALLGFVFGPTVRAPRK